MARSFRHPVVKITDGPRVRKLFKRLANRAVRRADVVASGSAYRKVFESYDIEDYSRPVFSRDLREGLETGYYKPSICRK